MIRIKTIALGGIAAALVMAGAASKSFALESGSFDNRLFGATEGLPLGAAAPPGVYAGTTSLVTPNFWGTGNRAGGTGLRFPSVGTAVPVLWSTGWKFLGASYSVAVVQPFYVAGTLPPGFTGLGSAGPAFTAWSPEIANTIWTPINLSWNLGGGWFVAAGFNFMAPDGSRWTSTAGAVDTNPDYWTYEPTLAISYLSASWTLSANMFYDINGPSAGTCCNGGTVPAASGGIPAAAASGYTSGNAFYADLTALYKIDKWELGPVGYLKFQTTNDSPGGGFSCYYNAVGAPPPPGAPAKSVQCGRAQDVAVGGLVGYNFGPVAFQVWVTDAVYNRDSIDGFGVWWRLGFRIWAPESPKPLVAKN